MFLRTLVVNGFKSFPETKIDFPNGITAVVGPNGTGKSNIVDAILWAMGEQSVKSLRSERMEDVIFNGTEQRKPLGMVEASLIFSDVSPRELEPVSALLEGLEQPTEVMITRRLYRDGDSEYSFNKVHCRLKDIRGFLWNARAGTRGQSVIEQGNIEQLLNASPQDRREFIEGTAGIIRYKKQKAEALRKLKSTENNLLRVRDILGEVRHQLRTLNRQAKQAEEYQTLQEEARRLEVELLTHDYRKFFQEQVVFEQELQESQAQELACEAEEARVGSEQEKMQLSLSTLSETLKETQGKVRDIEQEMNEDFTTIQVERNRLTQFEQQHERMMQERARVKEEGQEAQGALESLRERMAQVRCEMEILSATVAESEVQLTKLVEKRGVLSQAVEKSREQVLALAVEKTNKENRLRSIEEGRGSMVRRLERLGVEVSDSQSEKKKIQDERVALGQERSSLEERLEDFRNQRERLQASLSDQRAMREERDQETLRLQTQIAASESHLRALQSLVREELGFGHDQAGTQDTIRAACTSIKEALAERMEVPEELEKAIEAALGEQLRGWVVDSQAEVEEAIRQLNQRRLGKSVFIPLDVSFERHDEPDTWFSQIEHDPAVRGLARSVIRVPSDLQPVVDRLLGRCAIVETLGDALRLMKARSWFNGHGPLLVTLTGEVVSPLGVISGGSAEEAGGLLYRRREIATSEETLHSLKEQLEEEAVQRERVDGEIEDLLAHLQDTEGSLREAEHAHLKVKQEENSKEQALPDLQRRLDILEQEQIGEEQELETLTEEDAEIRSRLRQLEGLSVEENESLRGMLEELKKLDQEYQEGTERLNEVRVTYQTLKTQWDHEQHNIERIQQEEEQRQSRLQHLDSQLEDLFFQSRHSQNEKLKSEERIGTLEIQKEHISGELMNLENQYAGYQEEVRRLDGLMAQAREALSQVLKARVPIEGHLAEARTKLGAVQETLSMTYEISTDDLIASARETPLESGDDSPSSSEDEQGTSVTEEWRERLQRIRRKLERIGPINLAAIEEHSHLEERFKFLLTQEEDLAGSMQSLQEIIQRLNQTTNKLFKETFQELQVKFTEVFSALFAGGRAELVLVEEDAANEDQEGESLPLEPGVEIVAQPPGKRLKNLSMLSGGEKTMTVMALLFASFLVKPSPFCVLDEVDAPLDETNVVRFGQFLRQMADLSQFIVITHNKRTMEVAHSLFGVTMEEPGVSKLVSVRLHELEEVGT